jgi:hypothetical protein
MMARGTDTKRAISPSMHKPVIHQDDNQSSSNRSCHASHLPNGKILGLNKRASHYPVSFPTVGRSTPAQLIRRKSLAASLGQFASKFTTSPAANGVIPPRNNTATPPTSNNATMVLLSSDLAASSRSALASIKQGSSRVALAMVRRTANVQSLGRSIQR